MASEYAAPPTLAQCQAGGAALLALMTPAGQANALSFWIERTSTKAKK